VKYASLLMLFALAACGPQGPEPTHTRTWHLEFAPEVADLIPPELVVDELNKIWAPYCVMFDAYEDDTRTVHIQMAETPPAGLPSEAIGWAAVGGDAFVNAQPITVYPEYRWPLLLAIVISHEMGHSYGMPHLSGEKPLNGCDIMYESFWGICSDFVWSLEEEAYLYEVIRRD